MRIRTVELGPYAEGGCCSSLPTQENTRTPEEIERLSPKAADQTE
jgi:hypothetical protein